MKYVAIVLAWMLTVSACYFASRVYMLEDALALCRENAAEYEQCDVAVSDLRDALKTLLNQLTR